MFPEYVPPLGDPPVNVKFAAPKHTGEIEAKLTVGTESIVIVWVTESLHAPDSARKYCIVSVLTIVGVYTPPLTFVPEYTPPVGVAVFNVNDPAFKHLLLKVGNEIIGTESTLINDFKESLQPLASVNKYCKESPPTALGLYFPKLTLFPEYIPPIGLP